MHVFAEILLQGPAKTDIDSRNAIMEKYTKLSVIGQGTFGAVYLVRSLENKLVLLDCYRVGLFVI